MINSISGMNQVVVNGGTAFMPYVNMSNPSAGMIRYNGSNQCVEVYDGTSWLQFTNNHATIDLSGSANAAIAWAKKKMAEEAELEALAQKHPAVAAALENLNKAKEQLRIIAILSKETPEDIPHHPV